MGGPSQEEKITALIEKDPELKTLVQEHRMLDEKLKLAKKDKIAQRLSGH